jgi:hypothetical protein
VLEKRGEGPPQPASTPAGGFLYPDPTQKERTTMHDERDPLAEAVYRAAEYGSPPMTFDVPENTTITPGPLPGPMLDGIVIQWWS